MQAVAAATGGRYYFPQDPKQLPSIFVKEAKTFRGPDYVYPGYSYPPWEELAKLLVSIAPPGLTKAFRAGLNVVRVNVRNCGDTETLTPTLYHAGLTVDLRAVIDELISRDRLTSILVGGFSLGGNMVLKLSGEYGDHPPRELKAMFAISPRITSLISI